MCHGRGSLARLVMSFCRDSCPINAAVVHFDKIYSISPQERLFLTLQYTKLPKTSSSSSDRSLNSLQSVELLQSGSCPWGRTKDEITEAHLQLNSCFGCSLLTWVLLHVRYVNINYSSSSGSVLLPLLLSGVEWSRSEDAQLLHKPFMFSRGRWGHFACSQGSSHRAACSARVPCAASAFLLHFLSLHFLETLISFCTLVSPVAPFSVFSLFGKGSSAKQHQAGF